MRQTIYDNSIQFFFFFFFFCESNKYIQGMASNLLSTEEGPKDIVSEKSGYSQFEVYNNSIKIVALLVNDMEWYIHSYLEFHDM